MWRPPVGAKAVDMWTTAKRRSCPHIHSYYDD